MARADLERALQPGEHVLWAAQHDWRATMRGSVRTLAIVALAFAALWAALYFVFRGSAGRDTPLALMIAAPFAIAWVIVAALALLAARWTRRRVYAITDRAALVTRRDPRFSVERYTPSKADVSLRTHASGAGDLIFAHRQIGSSMVQPLGFFQLENAYAVQRILLEAPFIRAS